MIQSLPPEANKNVSNHLTTDTRRRRGHRNHREEWQQAALSQQSPDFPRRRSRRAVASQRRGPCRSGMGFYRR
jgi:hypothetical protein